MALFNHAKIFYFSGTGNTKAVCGMLMNELNVNHGCQTECINIESEASMNPIPDISPEELIGIAYPTYGFGCPSNMIRFVKGLSGSLHQEQKVFLLQTAGDFIRVNHWAGNKILRILSDAGIHVVYERIIVMPSNFFIRYDDRFNQQLYKTALLKTNHMANELLAGIERHPKPGTLGKHITNLVNHGEEQCGARLFGMSLRAGTECDRCGVCVRNCPTGNPKMTVSGVRFTGKCLMCMRCVYTCHKHCITSTVLNRVILKDGYNLNTCIDTPQPDPPFVDDSTKGFYGHFNKYLKNIEG